MGRIRKQNPLRILSNHARTWPRYPVAGQNGDPMFLATLADPHDGVAMTVNWIHTMPYAPNVFDCIVRIYNLDLFDAFGVRLINERKILVDDSGPGFDPVPGSYSGGVLAVAGKTYLAELHLDFGGGIAEEWHVFKAPLKTAV